VETDSTIERPAAPATPPLTGIRLICRIVWGIALLVIVVTSAESVRSFQLAESAPQQAAAAGWACFQIILPYVIARAIHETLTA